MGAICSTPICPPLTREDSYAAHEAVSEVITTPSALIRHLQKTASTPHLRRVCRSPLARPPPAEIGPVIRLLMKEIDNCAPGTTYVLPLDSQMGKSMASEYAIDNLGRNGLHFSAAGLHKDRGRLEVRAEYKSGRHGSVAMFGSCIRKNWVGLMCGPFPFDS